MNKPANLAWEEAALAPRWYLWDGGFLVTGRAGGEVPAHSHHTIQVHVATVGRVAIRAGGEPWREAGGLIVRADVEHSFNALEATGAMLMVDPESAEGAWLQATVAQDITLVPEARREPCAAALRDFMERPLEAMEPAALVRFIVQSLCAGGPPSRRLEPRIAKVLEAIRASKDLRMSQEEAAAIVHLSPGRFAHLFKDEVGLPYRRYLLWRKVARAMLAAGREKTLAAAAQEGDFADAAHLTRTFYQMFGIPPSVLMRGEFFEIDSPFTSYTPQRPNPRGSP